MAGWRIITKLFTWNVSCECSQNEELIPPYGSYPQGNKPLSSYILKSNSRGNKVYVYMYSRDTDFAHVDSPSGFTRISTLHENIHAKREVTLCGEERDAIYV